MFANVLKKYGFSINSIAPLLHNSNSGKRGVSFSAAYQIVNGNPTLNKIIDLANALNITPDELLREANNSENLIHDPNIITCPKCGAHVHFDIVSKIDNITSY